MNRGHTLKWLYLAVTLPILMVGIGTGVATWAHAQETSSFTAQLAMLNDSGASGSATATLVGDQLTINIHSTGLTPNQPHAQHLHIGSQHACPTTAADMNHDGLISTVEGQPSYGPIMVSLTTTGDVTAASGLAIDRFPKADTNGTLDYQRTFTLPAGVTRADIASAVVVQHGVDVSHDGSYDGTAKSELDQSLPLEATLPANCGKAIAPTGVAATTAPNTGDGTSAGTSNAMFEILMVVGIVFAIGGAGTAIFGISRFRD